MPIRILSCFIHKNYNNYGNIRPCYHLSIKMTSSQEFQYQPDIMDVENYDRLLSPTPTREPRSSKHQHSEVDSSRPSINSQAIEPDTKDGIEEDDCPNLSQPSGTLILVHFQIEIDDGLANDFPSSDFLQLSSKPSFTAIIRLPQRLTIQCLHGVLERKLQEIFRHMKSAMSSQRRRGSRLSLLADSL